MQLFLLMSFLFVCVGGGLLGARLLLAGMRTRTAPELAYGSALLLMAIGAVVRVVVYGILGGGPEYHAQMIGAGVTRLVTLIALTCGIHVIFRPGVAWSKVLVAAYWLLGLSGLAVVVAYPGGIAAAGAIYSLGDLAAGLVSIWGAAESFSYWGKLRRRLALGLADPVTTAQFRMWGVSFTFATVASFIVTGATVALNAPITGFPPALVAVQICLIGMTGLTWLAFYPPQRFQAWMRTRHAATARP
jgi:hypothetical protein